MVIVKPASYRPQEMNVHDKVFLIIPDKKLSISNV